MEALIYSRFPGCLEGLTLSAHLRRYDLCQGSYMGSRRSRRGLT